MISGMMTDSPYLTDEYVNFDSNIENFIGHKDKYGRYSFQPFYNNIIKYHGK